MKKLILLGILLLVICRVEKVYSQQLPLNNQYIQYRFLYNPAEAGNTIFPEIFINSRRQWVDIDGAPETSYFGLHKSFTDKVGLGITFSQDKVHMLEKLSGNVAYSYKVNISETKEHNLTFGLQLGFIEQKIDLSKAVGDITDPVLMQRDYDTYAPDASFGLRYRLHNFELGIAAPQLLANSISYKRNGYSDLTFNLKNHFQGFAAYKFIIYGKEVSDNNVVKKSTEKFFYLEPSVFYRSVPLAPSQMDLNLSVKNYLDQWIAVTYRPTNSAFVMSAGIALKDRLRLGYSYEFTNSKLSDQSNGTHEVMISYRFIRKHEVEQMQQQLINKNQKEIFDELQGKQKQFIEKIDSLKNEMRKLNNVTGPSKEELEKIKKNLQDEMKNQLDSLRKQLNQNSNNPNQTIINVEPSDNEVDSIKIELEKLKRFVQEIKDKNVYEMKPTNNENGEETYVEEEIQKGCYVIIHSFRKFEFAKRSLKITKKEKGLDAHIIHNKDRGWYYIYTERFDSIKPALEKMSEVRKNYYDDAWVHVYKMSMK